MKTDNSDPEPEGLTLLVPDIQKTAEIVYAATTSLRQANQGMYTHGNTRFNKVIWTHDEDKYLELGTLNRSFMLD